MSRRVIAAGKLGPTFERVRAVVDMGASNAPASPRLAWPDAPGWTWTFGRHVVGANDDGVWVAWYIACRWPGRRGNR